MENTGKIVERYVVNGVIIEIVKSAAAYDVIYVGYSTGAFMKNVTLCEAYAFIAGYMYDCVKLMEGSFTRKKG